jgi:single-stranded-DNA-specific exonuclease
MRYRWSFQEPAPQEAVQGLAERLGLDPVLARILYQRGYTTPAEVDAFLTPDLSGGHDPLLLPGMSVAVDRLRAAIAGREPIRIHGDYDVDGVTAVTLITRVLRRMGGVVDVFIPSRTEEGYGLSLEAVRRAADDRVGVLVTVDCGISAIAEAALARRLGVDLIVTDHHTPGEPLPDALAVLNPRLPGSTYPFDELAGVGVAYKLALALAPPDAEPALMEMLDLVALGTTADVVPLIGENRVFVKWGLIQMARTRWPGLGALIDRVGLRREAITATQAVFHLAPRINAAGRMTDAGDALGLLLTDDPFEAAELARRLEKQNEERRRADETTLKRALEMIAEQGGVTDRRALVLCDENWHPGVIGIVASRLVERFHRPTVLVSLEGDTGKGSARSIAGFDLYDALDACAEHLDTFGGHRHAAGLTVNRERLGGFIEAFEAIARNRLTDNDIQPSLEVDVEIMTEQLTEELLEGLKRMEPFGACNRRPIFLAREAALEGRPRRVGPDQAHLRFAVRRPGARPIDGIGFGLGERIGELDTGLVDLVFAFEENEFRGVRRPQIRLKDLRPANA